MSLKGEKSKSLSKIYVSGFLVHGFECCCKLALTCLTCMYAAFGALFWKLVRGMIQVIGRLGR